MKYIALALIVALSACSTVSERTDRHNGNEFSHYDVPSVTTDYR